MSFSTKLNASDKATCEQMLTRCCGSKQWVSQMLETRPFQNDAHVVSEAEQVWWKLGIQDWLEAFSHHPKIGDRDKLAEKFASTKEWAKQEQAGTSRASEETLTLLHEGNIEYERKFGYIFIVCATGKSAEEMLEMLKKRLPNDEDAELKVAAGEQLKITKIRLEKL